MKVRFALALVVATAALLVAAMPSGATVHEIIGQWCAGKGDLAPRGISGGSNADNFARPLFASGVATEVPGGAGPGTILIQFNFDHPAIKIVPLGFNVNLGGPVWINAWTTDDDFPAFQNCPGYVGGGLP